MTHDRLKANSSQLNVPPLVLFDIDGTILRGGTEVHRAAFGHVFDTVYGEPSLSLEGISAAGRTDMWLVAEPLRRQGVAGEVIWEHLPRAFDVMNDYVERNIDDLHDRVLPGVPEVLAGLHTQGAWLGLLTGNLEPIALAKMRAAGLAHYFDTGGFGDESEIRSRLVEVALAKAGRQAGASIPPRRVVIVGDTPLDIEAAHAHGTQAAGVATGPFSEEELRQAGAELVLPSLADSAKAVKALLALLDGDDG